MNMIAKPAENHATFLASSELHKEKWRELCASYLPVSPENSIWRYSRTSQDDDPVQGWKLHISATILTATTVFERVAPYLKNCGTLFKAPRALKELQKLNAGLHYGYSQVGKFITVYPKSPQEARLLARKLHQLTGYLLAPIVPFDLRFRADSCIYYRYGSFEHLEIKGPDGTRVPAMRDREGNLVPDLRDSQSAKPDWVTDPFINELSFNEHSILESPLRTTYRVFQSLTQRGKGGVYKAIDLSAHPPRLCILKEGRRDGETTWDGRDGYWLIEHEKQMLKSLRTAGIEEIPAVYSSFEAEHNYYLVTECVGNETLQAFLLKRRRRLSLARALGYAVQLSTLLSRIHDAGWAWRDCKPTNIIITNQGKLRPVDFEGACPLDRPDPMSWSTPAFTPPERLDREIALSGKYDDLYALGTVIYFLLTGRLPDASARRPLEKLRRNIPAEVRLLVEELLDADPLRRPAAQSVSQSLVATLASLN